MEVHRQRCQACGSRLMRNLIVRGAGMGPTVFASCAGCSSLVARYRLSSYYHHGKGFESFLRATRWVSAESGRATLDEFAKVQLEAEQEHREAQATLSAEGKAFDVLPAGSVEAEAAYCRGQLEQARRSLLRVLEGRGLAATGAQIARIGACDDLAQLEAWLGRALRAASIDEAIS